MHDPTELREYTVAPLELRDVQAVGAGRAYRYIEGRAVPYDTWAEFDWFHEQHRRGSFKRSTDQHPHVALQLFHDNRRMPIGHAESWRHGDDGLTGVWRLNDTADAQLAAELAERGDLTGLSVGFQDKAEPLLERSDSDDKMWITRVQSRLVEVSMTATPAFAEAGVTMVRTAYPRPAPPEREADRWRRIYHDLMSR